MGLQNAEELCTDDVPQSSCVPKGKYSLTSNMKAGQQFKKFCKKCISLEYVNKAGEVSQP